MRCRLVRGIAFALALTVVLGCDPTPALQFSPLTLPDAQVGSAYAVAITVSQAETPVGSASVKDGALPSGLSLALDHDPENTVRISGTPTVAGTFSFRVELLGTRDRSGELLGAQGYTLVVE